MLLWYLYEYCYWEDMGREYRKEYRNIGYLSDKYNEWGILRQRW